MHRRLTIRRKQFFVAALALSAITLATVVVAPPAFADDIGGSSDSVSPGRPGGSDDDAGSQGGDSRRGGDASADDGAHGANRRTSSQNQPNAAERLEAAQQKLQKRQQQAADKLQQAQYKVQTRMREAEAGGGKKLDEAKLKACQQREGRIAELMQRMSVRGSNQVGLIAAVQDRAQAFATSKQLSISNYDNLAAAANQAKATAQSAVNAVNDAKAGFACQGNDPGGVGNGFGELVSARADAIQNYRDAVRNMVQAIKTAAKAGQTGQETTQS